MVNTRNFTNHLLLTFALSISLQTQVITEARAAEQAQRTTVDEATKKVIPADARQVQVSDQEDSAKKDASPKKLIKIKKRRRKKQVQQSEEETNPAVAVGEEPIKEEIDNNSEKEPPTSKPISLKENFFLQLKKTEIKIAILLAIAAAASIVCYKSGSPDPSKQDDDEKKKQSSKEDYFKEEELQKVTDDSIPNIEKVEGSAIIEDDELKGINLTFDIKEASNKEALKKLRYYVKVDEKSNIQVQLSDNVIPVLDHGGNIRKKKELTLSPNGKKIIQNEDKDLTLDLKVWIGYQIGYKNKVTQKVELSIKLPNILNCFQCIICSDTFKDKIEDEDQDNNFEYALSHCCQGKALPDGTVRPVHHYYCQECLTGVKDCAMVPHKIAYKTHKINLEKLAKYVPADEE